MSLHWHSDSQRFTRSFAHIPKSWENFIEFEEGGCWNCGGEMLTEFPTVDGYFTYETCGLCNGIGAIPWSVETFQFNPNWTIFPTFYNIFFTTGLSNLPASSGVL